MNPWKRIVFRFLSWFGVIVITSTAAAKMPSEAQKHLDAGLAYYDDPAGPRHEEAYREFLAAYEIDPAYPLLANIGTCALYLERDAEAIDAYERYLQKATPQDIPPKKRILMETDIKTLKASLVQVQVTVSPAKLILIDERFPSKGQTVTNRYEVTDGKVNLGLHPGNHRLTAHLEGYEDQRWEFDARPASTHSHEFKLVSTQAAHGEADKSAVSAADAPTASPSNGDVDAKDQPKKRPTPTSVYVGLAATGAFAATSAVTGFLAVSKKNDFVALNDGKHVSEARDARDAMMLNLRISDIACGAAVLSAGVTAYLYFSRPYVADVKDSGKQATWRLVPSVGTKRAGVSMVGSF